MADGQFRRLVGNADGIERHHAGTRFVWVSRLDPDGMDVGCWVCQRCGTVAEDFRLHGEWHGQLDRATGRVEGLGL